MLKGAKFSTKEVIVISAVSVVLLAVPVIGMKANLYEDADHVANMLAPILTFVGSVLVYLAFKAQIKANKDIQKQFELQYDDGYFFRLIDSINSKIINSSYKSGNETLEGYAIFKQVLSDLLDEYHDLTLMYPEQIICNIPEKVSDKEYEEFEFLFSIKEYAYSSEARENSLELKSYLLSKSGENYEYFKSKYDMDISEPRGIVTADEMKLYERKSRFAKHFCLIHFYHMDSEFRQHFYKNCFHRTKRKYAFLLDGYFRNVYTLLQFINKSKRKEEYKDFIQNNFTNDEKAIFYHYLMSCDNLKIEYANLILDLGLLEDMYFEQHSFYGLFNRHHYFTEIDNIKKLIIDSDT